MSDSFHDYSHGILSHVNACACPPDILMWLLVCHTVSRYYTWTPSTYNVKYWYT